MNTGVNEPSVTTARQRAKPSAAKSWLKAIELTSRIDADPCRLFADVVEDWSKREPDRPALISDIETFSYRTLADRINRYARWALSAGIAAGDTVCLLMPSRPDYIAAWLGITKVGGVVALINTKLVGRSLSHCINVADADHVIVADDLAEVFETAAPHLNRAPKIWVHGGDRQRNEYRRGPGWTGRKSAVAVGAARSHNQRSCIADLHVGDDRPAEGRQHQPPAHPELGRLVCRIDGRLTRRPVIRLPADLSQRRRHCRALQHAERGRHRWCCPTNSPRAISGRTSCAGIARCSSISASFADIF